MANVQNSPPPPVEYMRIKEVSQYIKVSGSQVRRLIKAKKFYAFKPDPKGRVILVRKSDVDAFLANGVAAAEGQPDDETSEAGAISVILAPDPELQRGIAVAEARLAKAKREVDFTQLTPTTVHS